MLTTRERRCRQREAEGGRTGKEGRKTKGRKGSRGKVGGERSMVGNKDEVKGLTDRDLNGKKNKQKPPTKHTHNTHTHL